MRNKRAQAQNQVFVYILAVVILSMILFFGYRAIKGFGQQSQQVSYIQLKTELTNAAKQIRSDYGSVSMREFNLPEKYTSICFAEPGSYAQIDNVKYPIIRDNVESGTGDSVFLFPEGTDSFDIGKIAVDIDGKSFGCVQSVGSKVKLRFEGLGDKTKISNP